MWVHATRKNKPICELTYVCTQLINLTRKIKKEGSRKENKERKNGDQKGGGQPHRQQTLNVNLHKAEAITT